SRTPPPLSIASNRPSRENAVTVNPELTRMVGPGCQEPTRQRRHSGFGNSITASQRPSGLNVTKAESQGNCQTSRPVATSHILTSLPFQVAVASQRPSGLIEQWLRPRWGPSRATSANLAGSRRTAWLRAKSVSVRYRPVLSRVLRLRPRIVPRNWGGPIRSPSSVSSLVFLRGQVLAPVSTCVSRHEPSGLN